LALESLKVCRRANCAIAATTFRLASIFKNPSSTTGDSNGVNESFEKPNALKERLLNPPQRKRLSFFKSRISAINKIQMAVVAGTRQRFVFPELQAIAERNSLVTSRCFSM
jgi:hypothetical protein